MSSFKLVSRTKIDSYIDCTKYKSTSTGLQVVLADVDGPIVNGYFVLATEAHDDDGLPHTLEHLIFLGSEKYPFKGALDLLANRCLASGTNAWTDTDHTCYTMTTAGSDGFLALIPIYLDHILYPILSDSGYATEVHHVSGEGEDGGVVYSEMQGRENTAESRAHLQMLRAAYPNSGYSAETGGIMHNLRTSCNNEKVRKYHAAFYRPENLTFIVTGKVKAEKVFAALQPIEDKINGRGDREMFSRPWQTPVEPIKESQDIKIVFPSDDISCGFVYIGYRGPNCVTDYMKLNACSILLRYLTDTSVSPLQREFVELDDPYASRVTHSMIENLESLLSLVFDNVQYRMLDLVLDKLKEILNRFVTGAEKIDMNRMKSILDRGILELLSNLENNPHDTAAYMVIGDAIYGKTEKNFVDRLNTHKFYEHFLTLDEKYWIDLLKEFLVDGNYICVRAFPCQEELERMSKEELARIESQRLNLGESGLLGKAEQLANAMATNEINPPDTMLTEVPVPSVSEISFHTLKIYKSSETDKIAKCVDFNMFPTYTEIFDINTNFIYITVSLNTADLNQEQQKYLMLFLEMLSESPVLKDSVQIPYEEVVAALERDTILSGTSLGLQGGMFNVGPFSHVATFVMQVDPKKYEIGVQWIIDILQSTVFTVERIRVCASKMVHVISQARRKGNEVARELLKTMYYGPDSNVQLNSMLRQKVFLSNLIEKLDNPTEAAQFMDSINEVRRILTQEQNVGVHIAANINKMIEGKINLAGPWKDLIQTKTKTNRLIVMPDWEIIQSNQAFKPNFQGTIVGMGTVESAFLYHATPSIKDFMDPDLPALLLYLQYLTQLEGSLWRQIRGQGFAYGYSIIPRPNEGLLYLSLYRASNVAAAFRECKSIIEAHLSSDCRWDENLIASARSSLIFELIERERSVGSLVTQSLLFSYKKVSPGYNQYLVNEINQVSVEKLNKVGQQYMSQLFAPQAKTAIVCHTDKLNEIVNSFKSMDRDLIPVSDLEESILGKFTNEQL